MKNTIKYTAAMLLVSASLNAYGEAKVSTSGRVKMDIGSTKNGPADWSGHNIKAEKAQMSLNIETLDFNLKFTLDAGQLYEKALTSDGQNVTRNPSDLARLLDEAYITFTAAGGEVTIGKQHIILIPNMETSSLAEPSKHEQVIGVHFSSEAREMLAGIGIDASFYETESYDNKFGDDSGFNVILSKQMDNNLKVFLALRNEKDNAGERENQITARGVYTINPKLQVSAQYQTDDMNIDGESSSLKFGSEYKISSDMVIGASYKSMTLEASSRAVVVSGTSTIVVTPEIDSSEFKVYGVKQLSKDTAVELYWAKQSADDSAADSEDDKAIGVRFDFKF